MVGTKKTTTTNKFKWPTPPGKITCKEFWKQCIDTDDEKVAKPIDALQAKRLG